MFDILKITLMNLYFTSIKYYFFIVIPVIFMSCGAAKNGSDSNHSLEGSFWLLQTLEGKTISHPDDPRPIGFELQETENRIVGFGGCNNFFGTYSLTQPDKIDFSPIGATKMACLMTTFNENDFFAVFDKTTHYNIRDGILTLFQGDKELATLKASKTVSE